MCMCVFIESLSEFEETQEPIKVIAHDMMSWSWEQFWLTRAAFILSKY